MSEGYRKALKRECDRERSRRMSRQGSFEASMLSFDEHMAKCDDPSKIATFSVFRSYSTRPMPETAK